MFSTRLLRGALALPFLFASAALAGESHGHAPSYTAGHLTITAPFTRATLPNAPVAGGYMSIANAGPGDDRLVAAESPVAGRAEIHEMRMEGDVMKMRELMDGLPLPAGETVELAPGGNHVMLMDLAAPLEEGGTVPLTLVFEQAGRVEVVLDIAAPGARAAHGAHGHAPAADQ